MAISGLNQDIKRSNSKNPEGIIAVLLSLVLGLSLSRVLFEGLFPRGLWLGRPVPAFLIAIACGISGWFFWRFLTSKLHDWTIVSDGLEPRRASWTAAVIFLPLLLNLFYLVHQQIDLAMGRMLFFSSLWLMLLLICRLIVKPNTWRWLSILLLLCYLAPIYLLTMGQSVGQADTFEFQVVVPKLGIVHPTGYPLYLLLTKLFTLIPINSIAWRVNLGTAIYGLAAVTMLYVVGWRLTGWAISSLLAAVILGLIPVFWSQSIQAEVYSLHALIVVLALLLMREVGGWRLRSYQPDSGPGEPKGDSSEDSRSKPYYLTVALALVLGLGLTNHLTTVILLPGALLTIFFAYRAGLYRNLPLRTLWAWLLVFVAFLLPLLIYVYLPVRWAAVNGEAMGYERFIDWVIGGRFQGALQLNAWLNDVTRYDIVGRLLTNEWPFTWSLIIIFVGAAYLFLWQWRFALILGVTFAGYVFYALNYYVPDLTVFLIPAQIILALWWLCGLVAALDLVVEKPGRKKTALVETIFILAGVIPLLVTAADRTWTNVDKSMEDDRLMWAKAVLQLPLPEGSAILADSDKYPPLYYLQQVEGIRPDLEIMVLPDEAAYRAELEGSLAAGQPVFLARYLPGLEGIYHLNSIGPLIQVSQVPQTSIPVDNQNAPISFGAIELLGQSIDVNSPYSDGDMAVTFYWRAVTAQDQVLQVYVRWVGDGYTSPISRQHPANNMYPTVAWDEGEIVSDFHQLPQPTAAGSARIDLQVALAPPFTPPEALDWETVATVPVQPQHQLPAAEPIRFQIGANLVDGMVVVDRARPAMELPVQLAGYGTRQDQLEIFLRPVGQTLARPSDSSNQEEPSASSLITRTLHTTNVIAPDEPGRYSLVISQLDQDATCGWLSLKHGECVLKEVEIVGVPLPDGAINFEDKIALLSIDSPILQITPGSQLHVDIRWQALAPLEKDYTVFVQVLDEDDKIVGQVDSWPVQGTFPTSQWMPGDVIQDPYVIQLAEDLPAGNYRLNIGLYLLETLRRLQVVDGNGVSIDDKVEMPGLFVPDL